MNRPATVTILALLTPMPPMVAIIGLSSNPQLFQWLVAACILSLILAIATVNRFLHQWQTPFYQLIEHLYGRQKLFGEENRAFINKLERAINFSVSRQRAEEADEVERLNDALAQVKTDQSEALSVIEEEKFRLESGQQELLDEQNYLKARDQLLSEALKSFTGACNRGETTPAISKEAEEIAFLLAQFDQQDNPAIESILQLTDATLSSLAPLLRQNQVTFHLLLDDDCPPRVEILPQIYRRCLFRLLLDSLESNQNRQLALRIGYEPGFVLLNFASNFLPHITLTADDMLSRSGADWQDKQLRFPAGSAGARKLRPPIKDLKALVITDSDIERDSLTQRLELLGVTCITDFKNEQLDLCLVTDEEADTFLSIQPYLPATTYILLLNNRTLVTRPYWLQIDDPLNQSSLSEIIEHIDHTRDEPRQMSVLIVDDSESNARLLEMQLTELGHAASIVTSGQDALDLIASQEFQAVFMDIQMPDMNGTETTRRIRQKGTKTPVYGLTAHATPREKETYLEVGMDDVLIKPVRIDNLRSMLRHEEKVNHRPPMPARSNRSLPMFDLELSLINANQRPELAAELLGMLIKSLPEDQKAINASQTDLTTLKSAVHKLHGAVRYCGVPRLTRAIEKLESALKQAEDEQVLLLLNLLNGEVTSLQNWYRENPDPFSQRSTG